MTTGYQPARLTVDGRVPCPDCGKLLKPQGLGPHRAKVHGTRKPPARKRRAAAPSSRRAAEPDPQPADPVLSLMRDQLALSSAVLDALEAHKAAVRPLRLEYIKLRKRFEALMADAPEAASHPGGDRN